MHYQHLIADPTTQHEQSPPLEQLFAALQELLAIHWANRYVTRTDVDGMTISDLPFLYLNKLQYVSGEKHARKSCMRLNLLVSPAGADHPAAETFTVELVVNSQDQ